MGVVVDPFARCRNPLACRDSGGVADNSDQIAMATGLCPQNAEAVLAIMEGDTLDQARQYFLGRWFLLWPHLCCRCWRQSAGSSSATQCPRVLSIGDRPTVGNRPAIQILGSLEAACDDGAIAAVGLITLGRPADSFGLSERCLLGAASSSCRRARCKFGPRCRSARRAERKRDRSDQGGWQRRGSTGLRGGQPVRTIPSPPSSLRKPPLPESTPNRALLRGFLATYFPDFGLCRR